MTQKQNHAEDFFSCHLGPFCGPNSRVWRLVFKIIPAIVAVFAAGGSVRAQPAPDELLYRQLTVGGKDVAVAALNQIVKNPEAVSTTVLYSALGVAAREKRLEDAGFIFYIARFRMQFDQEVFPPAGPAESSPLRALEARQQEWTGVISPALMSNPKVFASVLARVKAWNPRVPDGYHPGWEYLGKESEEQAAAVIAGGRKQLMEVMGGLCTLLQDDTYFAAFRICQQYGTRHHSDKQAQESYNTALATMERIEKERGILGLAATMDK
jgi:hypothetical protein